MKALLSLFRPSKVIEAGISIVAVIFMVTAVVFWSVGIRNYFFSHFVHSPAGIGQQADITDKGALEGNAQRSGNDAPHPALGGPRQVSESISGDTMLAIISVLAIIAGLLSWVFLTLVRSELRQEITERLNDDHESSIATTMITTGYLLWFHHHNTQAKPGEKQKETPFLDAAIDMAGMGLKSAVNIKNKKYEELVYICKNNLAFYMAYREKPADKENAYNWARELYEISMSTEGKKYSSRCHWQATWIFVLQKFYGDKNWAQEEAKRVREALEQDISFSPGEKEKIRELWGSLREKGLIAS